MPISNYICHIPNRQLALPHDTFYVHAQMDVFMAVAEKYRRDCNKVMQKKEQKTLFRDE